MAQVTIDLFFVTGEGFEGHIALIPGEGESGFQLLQSASKALKQAGCAARPVKGYGGGSGNKSAPPPDKCPECDAAIAVKDWVKDGKAWKIYKCSKSEGHFKPVYKLQQGSNN